MMESKYSFHIIILFLEILSAIYAMPRQIATSGEKEDDDNNSRSGDLTDVFEAFIRKVNRRELLSVSELKNSEDIISGSTSTPRGYKHGNDNAKSTLDGETDIHFKNMRSPSQNLMTEYLPTENLPNEARKIPPYYIRRAKRSYPHLSSLINVNTIPGVVKVHEGGRIHVDPRDIITAIAETIGVTASFLSGKVQVSSVNAQKTEADITSLSGSGYCGKVTVSI